MIARPPDGPVDVPRLVAELAGGDAVTPVWRNEAGGLTFDVGAGSSRRFVKWEAADRAARLEAEAERMTWARMFITVPRVVDLRVEAGDACLVTTPLDGESAVAPRWTAEPPRAAAAIGAGLRVLHDSLPVDSCPYDWSAERRGAAKLDGPTPPIDRLVVCHGDPCAPNGIEPDAVGTGYYRRLWEIG